MTRSAACTSCTLSLHASRWAAPPCRTRLWRRARCALSRARLFAALIRTHAAARTRRASHHRLRTRAARILFARAHAAACLTRRINASLNMCAASCAYLWLPLAHRRTRISASCASLHASRLPQRIAYARTCGLSFGHSLYVTQFLFAFTFMTISFSSRLLPHFYLPPDFALAACYRVDDSSGYRSARVRSSQLPSSAAADRWVPGRRLPVPCHLACRFLAVTAIVPACTCYILLPILRRHCLHLPEHPGVTCLPIYHSSVALLTCHAPIPIVPAWFCYSYYCWNTTHSIISLRYSLPTIHPWYAACRARFCCLFERTDTRRAPPPRARPRARGTFARTRTPHRRILAASTPQHLAARASCLVPDIRHTLRARHIDAHAPRAAHAPHRASRARRAAAAALFLWRLFARLKRRPRAPQRARLGANAVSRGARCYRRASSWRNRAWISNQTSRAATSCASSTSRGIDARARTLLPHQACWRLRRGALIGASLRTRITYRATSGIDYRARCTRRHARRIFGKLLNVARAARLL